MLPRIHASYPLALMVRPFLKKHPLLLPVAFLVLLILLPYWKLATMQGFVITDDIFTSDIMNEGFPYRHYISEALKKGELPTWLPYIYGGIPLLARAEAGVCYPFNLLLFGLLPPYVALNLVILLTLITAALGMYFYARELDVGMSGALVAALSFAYSGFMVSHIKHLSMVGTVCWFPFGLLVIERAFRRRAPSQLLWLGCVFGLQHLSGHTQTAYYSGLVYVCYVGFRLLSFKEKAGHAQRKVKSTTRPDPATLQWKPYALWFILAMMFGVGLSAVQLLPTYELVGLTQRAGGVTFDYAASYAYDPANFKTFFYPLANGDISNATYTGDSIFWEDYGYVGLLTFLLALVAVVRSWNQWHVRFFAFTAVVAYVFVLGPNTPVYEAAFYAVPGMKFFRFPTRFLFVVDAALCVLAALGATGLLAGRRAPERSKLLISPLGVAVVTIVIADLLFFQLRQNPIVDAHRWREEPKTVQRLKQDTSLFRIFSPGASEVHKAAFASARGWSGDLQPYIDQREYLQPSSNVLYGLSSADGYAQLTPNYVVDIWGDQNRGGLILQTASLAEGRLVPQASFRKIMNLFNVKYVISPWEIAAHDWELLERKPRLFIYRNPDVLPRAYFVERPRVAATPEIAKQILLSEDFDPTREVILHENVTPGLSTTGGGSATVEQYRTNRVEISATTTSGGILVLSDTFYPGWNAYIDGVRTNIYRANYCQRAVVVPAGSHTVEFRFESPTILWGFVISCGTWLGGAGLAAMKRRHST